MGGGPGVGGDAAIEMSNIVAGKECRVNNEVVNNNQNVVIDNNKEEMDPVSDNINSESPPCLVDDPEHPARLRTNREEDQKMRDTNKSGVVKPPPDNTEEPFELPISITETRLPE